MPEVTYLPEVECFVSPGFLESEVTVAVPDEKGNRQFLRAAKDFITYEGERAYLPVGIVQLDHRNRKILIELPHEADSGVNRLWVPFQSFRQERNGTWSRN